MNSHVILSQTGLSHACANGFMPILEILAQVSDVDVNMADNDGNTPLIFAACADHAEVVNFLLHNFRRVRIDQTNHLGFTALMKAAINGRERAAKILIFAGLTLQMHFLRLPLPFIHSSLRRCQPEQARLRTHAVRVGVGQVLRATALQ